MVGVARVRVKAVVACALLAVACAWRADGRAAAVHVEVLVAEARKGRDLVERGRLTAESMPELIYPLERARAFAREAAARGGDSPPAWLAPFDVLVERYRAFVDALDRVRREARGETAAAALAGPLAEVEAAAARVEAALPAGIRR